MQDNEVWNNIRILTAMVRGTYDLQDMRMRTGLRLCANFRAKLKVKEGQEKEEETVDADEEDGELGEEAVSIIKQLKDSYKRLTDGIARNRNLPAERGFVGDELISTYAELVLVDQYARVEQREAAAFRQFLGILEKIPIYTEFLQHQTGVGPAIAGAMITYFNPYRAPYVSSFWKYAGLDLGPDGRGRGRFANHLVDRTYTSKNGTEETRKSLTYEPWIKSKLLGALATSFLRQGSEWTKPYYDYKHRLETDPARVKIAVEEWKKRREAGEEVGNLWTPGRLHNAAKRYMIKIFLGEFWRKWREFEKLSMRPSYHQAVHGHIHGVDIQLEGSFNKNHPERRDDEVFISNADSTSWPAILWNTKRKGNIAYSVDGRTLGKAWLGAFPVFVKKDEIQQHDPKILEALAA